MTNWWSGMIEPLPTHTHSHSHMPALTWQQRSIQAWPPAPSPLTHRLIINLIMFSQSCPLITLILLCARTDWGLVLRGTGERRWALSIYMTFNHFNSFLPNYFLMIQSLDCWSCIIFLVILYVSNSEQKHDSNKQKTSVGRTGFSFVEHILRK